MNKPMKSVSKNVTYSNLQDLINLADGVIKNNPEMTYEDFELDLRYGYYSEQETVLEWYVPMTEEEISIKKLQEDEEKAKQKEFRQKQYEALKKEFGSEV